MNSRIKYLVVTTSTCVMLVLVLGTVLGRGASTDRPYPQLGVYTEVLHRIKSEYVEEPDMKSVTLGALNGLLESVDPFASYLNADQYKDYLKNKDAHKAGVGLVLAKKFGFVGIVGVIPDRPPPRLGWPPTTCWRPSTVWLRAICRWPTPACCSKASPDPASI